jgi:hypothetical protein
MTKIRPALLKALMLLCSLIFAIGFKCRAQPTEYQIKAAFIYNFARFVEWPPAAFADTNSPMIIGVLGQNVFGNVLAQTISGKTVKGHPLEFEVFKSAAEATKCHVLFISSSEKTRLSKILAQLQSSNILTVGDEMDNFITDGGMINLRIVDDKVRFEINNEAAKKADLIISSKLLRLAINTP